MCWAARRRCGSRATSRPNTWRSSITTPVTDNSDCWYTRLARIWVGPTWRNCAIEPAMHRSHAGLRSHAADEPGWCLACNPVAMQAQQPRRLYLPAIESRARIQEDESETAIQRRCHQLPRPALNVSLGSRRTGTQPRSQVSCRRGYEDQRNQSSLCLAVGSPFQWP
jgi:hypothetical protein